MKLSYIYWLLAIIGMSLLSYNLYPDIIRVKHNPKTPQPQKPKRVKSLLPETKEKSIQKDIENAEKETELARN